MNFTKLWFSTLVYCCHGGFLDISQYLPPVAAPRAGMLTTAM